MNKHCQWGKILNVSVSSIMCQVSCIIYNHLIMRIIVFTLTIIVVSFISGYFLAFKIYKNPDKNIIINRNKIEKPLEKYSFDKLSKAEIKIGTYDESEKLTEGDDFVSYLFRYRFIPEVTGGNFKTISGVVNYPKNSESKKYPIVLLIRGYVDQKNYTSGTGTKNIGQYLTKNGFITVAPDFLGYGESDSEAGNIFESRFQTYVTALSLIKSIENGVFKDYWDGKNLFIWGHSNGGQIALTLLELTGKDHPTVLWAPVSKPFPYSVLYYTDESEDHGRLIRSELSKFENLYDVERYSLTNYLDKINAPIQLHQGTVDDAVPVSWSNSLVSQLKVIDKEIEYIKHSGADHNMQPGWNKAAEQSLNFFIENKK